MRVGVCVCGERGERGREDEDDGQEPAQLRPLLWRTCTKSSTGPPGQCLECKPLEQSQAGLGWQTRKRSIHYEGHLPANPRPQEASL